MGVIPRLWIKTAGLVWGLVYRKTHYLLIKEGFIKKTLQTFSDNKDYPGGLFIFGSMNINRPAVG